MEKTKIVHSLKKLKYKLGRDFLTETMKSWPKEKLEAYYQKNEESEKALGYAIACVENIEKLKNINSEISQILKEFKSTSK